MKELIRDLGIIFGKEKPTYRQAVDHGDMVGQFTLDGGVDYYLSPERKPLLEGEDEMLEDASFVGIIPEKK